MLDADKLIVDFHLHIRHSTRQTSLAAHDQPLLENKTTPHAKMAAYEDFLAAHLGQLLSIGFPESLFPTLYEKLLPNQVFDAGNAFVFAEKDAVTTPHEGTWIRCFRPVFMTTMYVPGNYWSSMIAARGL